MAAIVSILVLLLGPQPDVGVPEWNGSFLLVGITGHLSLLAFANLARAAIRGDRRHAAARRHECSPRGRWW